MGQDIPGEYPDYNRLSADHFCAEYKIYSPPPIKSRLFLLDGAYGLVFDLRRPMPNRWWRLWQRVFFGFRWEKV
jgi:hypothetical protein